MTIPEPNGSVLFAKISRMDTREATLWCENSFSFPHLR
jgi:hypothetical protein